MTKDNNAPEWTVEKARETIALHTTRWHARNWCNAACEIAEGFLAGWSARGAKDAEIVNRRCNDSDMDVAGTAETIRNLILSLDEQPEETKREKGRNQ